MATEESLKRRKYGKGKEPIAATRAFVKELPHFKEKGIDGKAWLLVNDNDGTRVSVNTYNGEAGKNFIVQRYSLPEGKELRKLLKGYEEVDVTACPVAVEAGAGATANA